MRKAAILFGVLLACALFAQAYYWEPFEVIVKVPASDLSRETLAVVTARSFSVDGKPAYRFERERVTRIASKGVAALEARWRYRDLPNALFQDGTAGNLFAVIHRPRRDLRVIELDAKLEPVATYSMVYGNIQMESAPRLKGDAKTVGFDFECADFTGGHGGDPGGNRTKGSAWWSRTDPSKLYVFDAGAGRESMSPVECFGEPADKPWKAASLRAFVTEKPETMPVSIGSYLGGSLRWSANGKDYVFDETAMRGGPGSLLAGYPLKPGSTVSIFFDGSSATWSSGKEGGSFPFPVEGRFEGLVDFFGQVTVGPNPESLGYYVTGAVDDDGFREGDTGAWSWCGESRRSALGLCWYEGSLCFEVVEYVRRMYLDPDAGGEGSGYGDGTPLVEGNERAVASRLLAMVPSAASNLVPGDEVEGEHRVVYASPAGYTREFYVDPPEDPSRGGEAAAFESRGFFCDWGPGQDWFACVEGDDLVLVWTIDSRDGFRLFESPLWRHAEIVGAKVDADGSRIAVIYADGFADVYQVGEYCRLAWRYAVNLADPAQTPDTKAFPKEELENIRPDLKAGETAVARVDGVVAYLAPDGAEAVWTLRKGAAVVVKERGKEREGGNADGCWVDAYWYRVEAGSLSGWVFGGFLDALTTPPVSAGKTGAGAL